MQTENSQMMAVISNIDPPIQRLAVDEFAAAEAIGVSVYFLRKDRRTRRLIPYYRLGDRVLYSIERVREALVKLEEGGVPLRRGRRVAA